VGEDGVRKGRWGSELFKLYLVLLFCVGSNAVVESCTLLL
jgi:hypothetical protein